MMERFVALVVLASAACASGPSEGVVYEENEVPAELRDYVARADEGLLALQTELLEALTTALGRSGASEAIHVCRDVAQSITRRAAETEAVALGRTSHRLRNPDNAPPDWVRPFVEENQSKKAADVSGYVVDLGASVGRIRPIGFVEMCAQCHGEPARLDPGVAERLRESYPHDEATGFAVGDLRGLFWAEVPK